VVRVRSGINKGLRWIVGSSIHGCWLGHYEIEKQAVIRRLVKPGMKVFDVGANAGFYALAFARLVGAGGHVWAFEPLEANLQNLRRHVALNGLTNVTVVQAAVADRAGVARFAAGASNSMGRLAEGGNCDVQTVSLDEFCVQAGIDSPDLIKLDIEGGESLALKGAGRIVAQGKATILLALHGREQEKNCLGLLRAGSYGLRYLDGEPVRDGPLRSDEIVAFPPGKSSCAG
jgi:FkbM family methyltransferase